MLVDAAELISTRETAPEYNPGMSTAHTLIHGLFLTLSALHVACGDNKGGESGSESTGLPENQYCKNPPYPGDVRAMNTCGCGLSAISEEKNPFYLNCAGETCADNPEACPPVGVRAACLWDGDLTTSPGSFCARPCGNDQACETIEGLEATCKPVQTEEGEKGLCVLACSDAAPCPSGMMCVEDGSLLGFGAYYCIYELSS